MNTLQRVLVARRPGVRFTSTSKSKSPTNHEIQYETVQVLRDSSSQDSSSALSPPTPLSTLLSQIDKSTHLIRLISHDPPIVRVLTHLQDQINKLEWKASQKSRLRSSSSISTKEVRLTWMTTDADYEHKLAGVRRELEKGPNNRAEFLFSPTKATARDFRMSRHEMQEQVQKVADQFADISNEWKQREMGRTTARLFLQSTLQPPKKPVEAKEEWAERAMKEIQKRDRRR